MKNKRLNVHVNLSSEDRKLFGSLKQRTKFDLNVDLMRHSILLAYRLYQHKKDGGQIVLESADGKREILTLL